MTSVTALGPCTATSSTRNRTAGQRRRAFSSTSFSAADARPQTTPTTPGRNGSGRLRSAANSPSAASTRSQLLEPGEQLADADLPDLVGGQRQRAARGEELRPRVHDDVRALGEPAGGPSSRAAEQVTASDMSAAGSRSVRNTVRWPGRRVICATWPSTQTQPSRPIHSVISWLTLRTGTGCSAEVSRGTGST